MKSFKITYLTRALYKVFTFTITARTEKEAIETWCELFMNPDRIFLGMEEVKQ